MTVIKPMGCCRYCRSIRLFVMTRVLGIDPGLQITGYGLVDLADGQFDPILVEAGVIRLATRQSIESRLVQLYEDLDAIIDEFSPTCAAVEKLYAHYRHPRTAILMAHARGAILVCVQRHNIPVAHLPSTEVKKAVTGYGHASKLQMQRAVQAQCRLKELPAPPDVADAIAIALIQARRMTLNGTEARRSRPIKE